MNGLAAELVHSLFCGLPRLEKRLAVYLAASDETAGGGIFHLDFFTLNLRDVSIVNDFTHSGIETLHRHWADDGIGPVHDPVEIATTVHRATIVMGMTTLMVTQDMSDDRLSEDIAKLIGRTATP